MCPSLHASFCSDCSARRRQTDECSATGSPGRPPCAAAQQLAYCYAEAKDRRLRASLVALRRSLDDSQQANAVPGATEPGLTPHKKSSLQHQSSPTPSPRQNNDALRPLGNSKTALRAAAAPARPRPRLARRVGTIGSASLEGGGQPRALHAATRRFDRGRPGLVVAGRVAQARLVT